MELIYSTNVLTDAERLSSLLTAAGLPNHVSGVNAARLPGFFAMRTPSSIGVWLASASELARARQVMLAAGFLEQPGNSALSAVWLRSLWFKVAVAALVAILVAFAAYGP